jgi:outer membrane autotransporter protein
VVGAVTAQAGSTVAPGRVVPFSTLSVAGNVTLAQGSTYEVNINPAGLSDHLLVGGSATLQGGTVSALSGSGLYLPDVRYNLIAAQGGISGNFAQLSTTTDLAFLRPLLSYDASDVYLAFTQTVAPVSFASVALTHNQAATAAAVQTLGLGNAVYNVVLNQSVSGARQAFDALSGEVRASAVTAGFEDSRLPREAILDHLSQPLDTPFLGVTSTATETYAADLPSGKGRALAPVEVTMVRPSLFGLWGQGFGDWGRTGSDHNAAKLTRDTGGFIIGADSGQQFFGGNWHFGVAGGYTDDSLKVSGHASSGNYQTIFGALYGAANYGAVDLKAGTVIASTDTRTTRTITFPLFSDQASAHYGGTAAQAFGEAGYHIPVAVLPGLAADLEPVLQGALIHLDQDRSVETSLSGARLIGASKGYDLATTTFGLRGEYRLAGLPGWTLQSMVGWRHAFGDVTPSVTQSFAGTFSSFTVSGVPVDRNALTTQASLDYAFDERLIVGLSYSGQFGHRASDNAFKGNLALKF